MRLRLSTTQITRRQWRALAIGGAAGLVYGIISQQVDFEAVHAPQTFIWLSDVVSVILEGILGALTGLAVNSMRSQTRINRALSTENDKLQRHLLTQTLSAHVLHEIRTPLHNLAAVIEDGKLQFTPEDTSTLKRNLSRLQKVTTQLSRWTTYDDELDLREPVLLNPWLSEFILEKVQPRLQDTAIHFEQHVDQLIVQMHPLLLEQCLVFLFNNAMEAVLRGNRFRSICLTATCSSSQEGCVEMQILNDGELYPDLVLTTQGKEPIQSQHGLGLGLVLAHRSLELVGGSLQLTNKDGRAHTILRIPGHRA